MRLETPYLAYLQSSARTPFLDSYFAFTANMGTHTFFMVGLPVMFWLGHAAFGIAMVNVLAAGVFFTGWLKDLLSLPRPLSPPLYRITMSGSAALEYGFPSTHSANAVSAALYAVLTLRDPTTTSHVLFSPSTRLVLEAVAWLYAGSIVLGRLYCGMHGFLDVAVGSAMGAALGLFEYRFGGSMHEWMQASGWTSLVIVAAVVLFLVWAHPEPVDDCPCFDDSIAFAGVVMGTQAGTWQFTRRAARRTAASVAAATSTPPSWPVRAARVVAGVLVIFLWREAMKPMLLRSLPHLFRVIQRVGLSMPRRFFIPASEYNLVPLRLRGFDNVLPSVSDLPSLARAIAHPGRGRSVSVGPQSAADAYETLAYRDRRAAKRRESIGSVGSAGGGADGAAAATTAVEIPWKRQGLFTDKDSLTKNGPLGSSATDVPETPMLSTRGTTQTSYEDMLGWHAAVTQQQQQRQQQEATQQQRALQINGVTDKEPFPSLDGVDDDGPQMPMLTRKATASSPRGHQKQPSVAGFEAMMGEGTVIVGPPPADGEGSEPDLYVGQLQTAGDGCGGSDGTAPATEETFGKLARPRARYDVEVVTKLVVYAGMCPSISIALLFLYCLLFIRG